MKSCSICLPLRMKKPIILRRRVQPKAGGVLNLLSGVKSTMKPLSGLKIGASWPN